MKNPQFLHAVLTKDGYVLSDSGVLIERKFKNTQKEIYVVQKTRERRFYPTQEVYHQGERFTIEKISKNGWVKFVGIKTRTRINYIEAVVKEMETYYTVPTDQELDDFIKIKFGSLKKFNIIDFIFNFRKSIKEIAIAVDMI